MIDSHDNEELWSKLVPASVLGFHPQFPPCASSPAALSFASESPGHVARLQVDGTASALSLSARQRKTNNPYQTIITRKHMLIFTTFFKINKNFHYD